uniref:Alpha-n-acetylglucosaminidase isoform x2 n=1 Tax=Triatoma infestans TaxID=30076 RepID=A0A161MT43_TRIIF
MVSDYYSARWKLFLSSAYEALKNNTHFDEYKVAVSNF